MSELESTRLPETDFLYQTYDLANWWKELLGQPLTGKFDFDKAALTLPEVADTAAAIIKKKINYSINYSHDSERWFVWDGRVYKPVDSIAITRQIIGIFGNQVDRALRYVKEQIEAAAKQVIAANAANAKDEAKKIRDSYNFVFGEHKRYRDGIKDDSGMTKTVNKFRDICTVSDTYFNDDTRYLVVRNGVIDLEHLKTEGSVLLLEHDPRRPVSSLFDASYDYEARCPSFVQFLHESIIDKEAVWFLQKCIGAAFMGALSTRVFVNLQGEPSSGKSMLIKIMLQLGGRYAAVPNAAALVKSSSDTNFYQDGLYDKRWVGFSEVPSDRALDDDFIKGVSGGDPQQTRSLHAKPRDWMPHLTMFAASNKPFKYDTRDDAMVTRMSPVIFPYSFVDAPIEAHHRRIDRSLQERILGERDGVLNWILTGMIGYLKEGLAQPQSVIEAREQTKRANSYAVQFAEILRENGYIDTNQGLDSPVATYVSTKELYPLFQHWGLGSGIKNLPGKITFAKDIADHFYGKKREYLVGVTFTQKYFEEAKDEMKFAMTVKEMESMQE